MAKKLAVITGAKLNCTNAMCSPEEAMKFVSTNDADGFNLEGRSIGCINDNLTDVNIFKFPCSKCTDGKPCEPKFSFPWFNGVPSVSDCDITLLTEDSKIRCDRGGLVSIYQAGQTVPVLLGDGGFSGSGNDENAEEKDGEGSVAGEIFDKVSDKTFDKTIDTVLDWIIERIKKRSKTN